MDHSKRELKMKYRRVISVIGPITFDKGGHSVGMKVQI